MILGQRIMGGPMNQSGGEIRGRWIIWVVRGRAGQEDSGKTAVGEYGELGAEGQGLQEGREKAGYGAG